MNSTELMKLASKAKPEVVEKIASTLKLMEAMAPEFVPEFLEGIDDILNVTHTKVATLADAGKVLGGAALATLGAAVASDLFDFAKRGLTKSTNWARIINANPELKGRIDPKRLRESFEVVQRYAPEFMADPIMGGSVLSAVADLPGQEMALIKDLIKSRGELINAKKNQFDVGKASTEAVKALIRDPENRDKGPKGDYPLLRATVFKGKK